MFKPCPNLSKEINDAIVDSELQGGVWISDVTLSGEKRAPGTYLAVGAALHVQTQNILYTIRKLAEGSFTIQGHTTFCPQETPCGILGSAWDGSMIKAGFIGRGMHLCFYVEDHGNIRTSLIEDIQEIHNTEMGSK